VKFILRWLKRLAILLIVLIALLLAPAAYVAVGCKGDGTLVEYAALLPEEHQRPETRTLLTYPEWHIVHAYEDYGKVIHEGDPHDFGYFAAIRGFWSSLCMLKKQSVKHGEIDGATSQMVYVIGVSFTAELALKALYEETLGRIATWIRGSEHAPLDKLTAEQASDYAGFLQQVPWYKWQFREDAAALDATATDAFRDKERGFAIGLEYRAKAAYAGVIEQAVASTGKDELTLRMVIDAPPGFDAGRYQGVSLVEPIDGNIVIETPRYRALTHLLEQMAADGVGFIEIAGNDDILLTTISKDRTNDRLMSLPRQGFGDFRNLNLVKVLDLAEVLQGLASGDERLEHIHDY